MQAYKTKVDIIYETLLEAIRNSVYKPGERIVISQLAKENSTSEIPVREAIRRLESEGYVEIQANRGPFVKEISPEKALSIFQIKGVLEGYASRLAIDYLSPVDFKRLREINGEMHACEQRGSLEEYGTLNIRFHLTIYEKLPQRELYDMICDLWKKWGITRSVFAWEPGIVPGSIQDHEKIIQLLEEKQYDAVEQHVREHKFRAGAIMSEHLKKAGGKR